MKKLARLDTKYPMLKNADVKRTNKQKSIKTCSENFTLMFGDRAEIVLENVTKVMGAVYGRMNANQNPVDLVKGNIQPLVDMVAGVKALKDSGQGGDTMALKSYIQKVKGEKQGLTPEQLEIEAVKQVGKNSKTNEQIKQAFVDFSNAIQQGDMEKATEIKKSFGQLFQFYQNLLARSKQGAEL